MRSDAIFFEEKSNFCLSHYAAQGTRGRNSISNTAHFRATKTSTGETDYFVVLVLFLLKEGISLESE